MSLNNCRVILVRPHFMGNLGSVARVMHNFGLRELVLVAPLADRTANEATRMATHGEFILQQAKEVRSIEEAIADCQIVFGTSALTDGLFRNRSFGTPDELLPSLVDQLPHGPCGLMFGPEPSGLSNEEITHCHGLIHIPTNPEYGALNLAQAVGICLYELRRCWLKEKFYRKPIVEPMPPLAVQEIMFQKLEASLQAIHFLYGPKAEALMHGLRHMISRAKPRDKEVKILFGLARQIQFVAKLIQEHLPELPFTNIDLDDKNPTCDSE